MLAKKAIKFKIGCGCFTVIAIIGFIMFLLIMILMNNAQNDTVNNMLLFNVSEKYLSDAYKYTLDLREQGITNDWVEMIAYVAVEAKDPEKYERGLLKEVYESLEQGNDPYQDNREEIEYYRALYDKVLHGLIGEYREEVEVKKDGKKKRGGNNREPDEEDAVQTEIIEKWGLRAFWPFAKETGASHGDDYGAARDFGGITSHEGNDFVAGYGQPIICMETGEIENIGWNNAGGNRIGIRSLDGARYWYYAHMSGYADDMYEGRRVIAGEIIGYVGDTGRGPEGTSGLMIPHLHVQIGVTYDLEGEEQEVWIDPYHVIEFLKKNKQSLNKPIVLQVGVIPASVSCTEK